MAVHSPPAGRRLALAAFALGVSCAPVRAVADEPPLPPPRPTELGAPERPPAESPPPAPKGEAPPASAEGCGIDAPIRLSSIIAGGDAVSLPDRPLIACEFAAVLADYVRLVVAPLGQ